MQELHFTIFYAYCYNLQNQFRMQFQTGQTPAKNICILTIKKDGSKVVLRSDFDSGNMGKVEIGINNMIIITPAFDCSGTEYVSHAKGWFYFGVKGLPLQTKHKFVIRKMNQLSSQSKFSQYFKPVAKYEGQQWMRIQNAMTFTKQDDTQLHFEFIWEKNVEVFFAYTYPFSFKESQKMLKDFNSQFKNSRQIYYKDEILIKSPQGRPLHLITISSHDDKKDSKEDIIHEKLFMENSSNRCLKFDPSKKIIFISARVHPAQTPSSHTLKGIFKFLLSKDARAHILRKNFVFKIVPMLNPDGVYNGHYRMDIFNQNLNRYYLNPDPLIQPSAFAVKKLAQYYKLQQRQIFYIDLHAHPQKKGNFIYGNAFDSHIDQVETQLFPKILALNCVQFDYQNSSFAKKQMSSKDKNDELTKQGCGRVVFQKQLGQIYSYTMQCGYTQSSSLNQIAQISNFHRKVDKHGVIQEQLDNIKSNYYSKKVVYFTPRTYENLGKAILVSILDLFDKNPFSRLPQTQYKDLNGLRKQISNQINKLAKDFNYKIYSKPLLPTSKGQQRQININQSKVSKSLNKKLLPMKAFKMKSENEIKTRNRTTPKIKIYRATEKILG